MGAVFVACMTLGAQVGNTGSSFMETLEKYFVEYFKIEKEVGHMWFMSIAQEWLGKNSLYKAQSQQVEAAFKRLRHHGTSDKFVYGMASEIQKAVCEALRMTR